VHVDGGAFHGEFVVVAESSSARVATIAVVVSRRGRPRGSLPARVGADLDARDDAPALESTRRRAARAEEGGVAADAVVAVSMTRAGARGGAGGM
jgi:hypothetical protein